MPTTSCASSTSSPRAARSALKTPDSQVPAFEKGLLAYFQTVAKPAWNELDKSKAIDAAMEKKLTDAIQTFKSTWKPAQEAPATTTLKPAAPATAKPAAPTSKAAS